MSVILKTDSYKLTHWKQYPPGTQRVYSYFESRGGEHPAPVFFGLQAIIKKHLLGKLINGDDVEEAEQFANAHFGRQDVFNIKGWKHINKDHNGHLIAGSKCWKGYEMENAALRSRRGG
jgi:nicotinamide phosphoribosyltransferase